MDPTMWLWLAIGAGVLAVLYGVVSTLSILRLPTGNARMQEIAAAIQAGADCEPQPHSGIHQQSSRKFI